MTTSKIKMITQQPVMKNTIPIPENRTTPDKVESSIGTLEFFDGVPIGDTKDTLRRLRPTRPGGGGLHQHDPGSFDVLPATGSSGSGADEVQPDPHRRGDRRLQATRPHLEQHLAVHVGVPGPQDGRPYRHRGAARRAGHPRRHVLPLHERHGRRRSGQRQGRQVPGPASALRR